MINSVQFVLYERLDSLNLANIFPTKAEYSSLLLLDGYQIACAHGAL